MPSHDQLPNNHVVGVLSGEDAAQALRSDLEQAGFQGTHLFHGEDIARTVDAKGEHSGPLGAVVKAIQDHLSEEQNYLAQYQEEARAGHEVIAVKVAGREQAEDVRAVLERHGARNIRFFGRLAVADLSPDSNPTPRSAESPEHWAGPSR
jgi:hypothetical protein